MDLNKNVAIESKDLETLDVGFTFAISKSCKHLVIYNKNKEFVL